MISVFLNAADNGRTARTLRASYYKTSIANFVHSDGHGATGIIVIKEL